MDGLKTLPDGLHNSRLIALLLWLFCCCCRPTLTAAGMTCNMCQVHSSSTLATWLSGELLGCEVGAAPMGAQDAVAWSQCFYNACWLF